MKYKIQEAESNFMESLLARIRIWVNTSVVTDSNLKGCYREKDELWGCTINADGEGSIRADSRSLVVRGGSRETRNENSDLVYL